VRAAIVGSKLLFPDGSIQHAGVAISQDGLPRNLYTGFPGDHPAVCKSRPLQAVTGACCLVRRDAFSEAGGFDEAFRNGYEDVDLCLRLGELGYEVHYCAASTLEHLESVSRRQSSAEIRNNLRIWRQRWHGRVRPDELALYVEDGLISLSHGELYPFRLHVSPLLARVDAQGSPDETDALLSARDRDVADLLREVVRLTVRVAELEFGLDLESTDATDGSTTATSPQLHEYLLDRIQDLQAAVAGTSAPKSGLQPFEPSPRLTHRRLAVKVRDAVAAAVPADAVVAVISKGDEELIRLPGGRRGCHFPQREDGTFAGHYPANGREAVAQLEELRASGTEFLVIPESSHWWLDHYDELRKHLAGEYREAARENGVCVVFDLRVRGLHPDERADGEAANESRDLRRAIDTQTARLATLAAEVARLTGEVGAASDAKSDAALGSNTGYQAQVRRIREEVERSLGPGSRVAVISKGDEGLLEFEGRAGWHFPQTPSGAYAGHHPADSTEAIAHLEESRTRGAEYLVIPETAAWWLEHYADFARYLDEFYVRIIDTPGTCVVYSLRESRRPLETEPNTVKGLEDLQGIVADMLPEHAAVAVLATGNRVQEAGLGRPFPQNPRAEERDFISELEALAAGEADYLIVPKQEGFWLRMHPGFQRHLEEQFRRAVAQERLCTIYALGKGNS
jgi:hypothetical protein